MTLGRKDMRASLGTRRIPGQGNRGAEVQRLCGASEDQGRQGAECGWRGGQEAGEHQGHRLLIL
jgi:hypothetical protein